MKFIVPNYSCLLNPWIGGYAPRSSFSLSSVLNWICWTPLPYRPVKIPKDRTLNLTRYSAYLQSNVEWHCYPVRPNIPKTIALFKGFHSSPACPSDKSSLKLTMSIEQWWKDTDRGKPKYWENNVSRCHCVQLQLDWLGSNPGYRCERLATNRLFIQIMYKHSIFCHRNRPISILLLKKNRLTMFSAVVALCARIVRST